MERRFITPNNIQGTTRLCRGSSLTVCYHFINLNGALLTLDETFKLF